MQEDFDMNIDYEMIGQRIRGWRIRKKMTQEQMATLIEREPAYISRIENGRQKPSLDTLLRICCALELNISDLLLDMSNVKKIQITARTREIELLLDGCNEYEIGILLQNAEALKGILKRSRNR